MENNTKKVAIIGIQGLPAKYGGFESLVENLVSKKIAPHIEYTVFCSSKDYEKKLDTVHGAYLSYVGFHANGAQSIIYDIVSMIKCWGKHYDVVLVLGVSGCVFLPVFKLFSKARLIVNIDGLEHKRAKWGVISRCFLKLSESFAVRWADIVISDNDAIKEYVSSTYSRESMMIPYGGDHVLCDIDYSFVEKTLARYSLMPKQYAVTVCRIEPENNCHIILEAYKDSGQDLLFIGNWNSSIYGKDLRQLYSASHNIRMVDPIYDIPILNVLRSNASLYIHGHSAGGTNPSLVEAMFCRIPILAYDVPYNKNTTGGLVSYFRTVQDILKINSVHSQDINSIYDFAKEHYTWARIVSLYEALY